MKFNKTHRTPSPKVSVIIPHYNMHSFLAGAVKSVNNQDYNNVELIIVDDGSANPIDVEQLPGQEITVLQIDHCGKPGAVNEGLEVATGDYFTILDADDRLPEKSISNRLKAIREQNADLCIGSFEVSYNNQIQSVRSIAQFAEKTNEEVIHRLLTDLLSPLHQNAMLFNRRLLQRTGNMDEVMVRGQDKDFAIRLIKNSHKIVFLDEAVYTYNRYDRPLIKRVLNRFKGARYKIKIMNRYFSGAEKIVNIGWGMMTETAKLVHDVFGTYKK